MLGVSQATRILEFVSIIEGKGAREMKDRKTLNSACYTNPFNASGDGAPYIFITKRGDIKFGHTLTGASALSEEKVTALMARHKQKVA